MSRHKCALIGGAVAVLALATGLSPDAIAQSFTLEDGDVSLEIDFSDPVFTQTIRFQGGPCISGLSGVWYGYNHSTLNRTHIRQTKTNQLEVGWSAIWPGASLVVDLQGGIAGGGEGTVIDTLYVDNAYFGGTAGSRLFTYNNFPLSGSRPAEDTASMVAGGRYAQYGSLANLEIACDGVPTHYEVSEPVSLLARLNNDDSQSDLRDAPPLGVPYPPQPGPAAVAFQWNRLVPPNSSLRVATVTKHFTLRKEPPAIPEPSSLALLASAAIPALLLRLSKRRRGS